MAFIRKKSKRTQNSSGSDLSEQAMNDSVRAAQIIFQKHASSQSSLNTHSTASSSQTPGSIISPQPRYKRNNSASQVHLSTNGRSSNNQIRRPILSPVQTSNSHNSKVLENSESAQAAAQLAAAHWSQIDERESNTPVRNVASRTHFEKDNGGAGIEYTRVPPPQSFSSQSVSQVQPPSQIQTQNSHQTQSHSKSLQQQAQFLPRPQPKLRSVSPNLSESSNFPKNPKHGSTTSITNSNSNASNTVLNGSSSKLKENRALPSRVPPPKIYFDKNSTEGANEYDFGEFDDNNNDDSKTEDNSDIESINSTPISNSLLSMVTDRSSFERGFEDDEDDDDEGDEDDDDDDKEEEEVYDDEDADVQGKYNSDYTDTHQNSSSSFSLATPVDANYDSTAAAVSANAAYGNMNKVDHPTVTYQGTLPDLIPNHTRQSRMGRLKTKIFGSRSKHRLDQTNNQHLGKSSVTSDEYGRPVVTTNQNMKFKTTMRGKEHRSAHDRVSDSTDEKNRFERYGAGDDIDSDVSSTDSDSDSVERNDEKRRRKRTYRLKRHLKNTAAAVPYTHHLHHHDHRHNHKSQPFNEDKPWKSHNDVGFVTPQERKRYEGMWVSNRCLYLELLPWWDSIMTGKSAPSVPLPEDGLMLNIVVKDIWVRSNLPSDLLFQIYDKVDTRQDGTLDRKSFIVGMWLVDQCLYGRKLPRELNQQVWDSVDRYIVNVINPATIKHIDKTKKKQMKQEIKNIKREIKNTHL